MSTGIKLTRDLFLKLLAGVYLLSFLSIFYQIQGLWGDEGILPAKDFIGKIRKKTPSEGFNISNFIQYPCLFLHSEKILNFLRSFPILKEIEYYSNLLSTQNNKISNEEILMFVLCIKGIIYSSLALFNFSYFFNPISFFILWIIYLNFYLIGQDFMEFQADHLLLEIGFLAIFYCSWMNKYKSKDGKTELKKESPSEKVVYYLLRFLLFKSLISNTFNKFASNNSLFQNLNYFGYYLQNQVFPSPISYYFYYNLDGLKKMIGAFFLVNETWIPFLFFITIWRRFAIFAGIVIAIQNFSCILLGNNGYLNVLIIILNISNFDDEFLSCVIPKFIYKYFDLSVQKQVKIKKPKVISMIENLENLKKKSNSNKPNKSNLENENDFSKSENKYEANNYYYQLEEDIDFKKSSKSSLGYEIMFFLNFSAVYALFLFLYLFPLKDILMNEVKFSTNKVVDFYKKFMVYFCHLVFIVFIYNFLKNYLDEFVNSFVLSDDTINLALKNARSNKKENQEPNFEEKKKSSILPFLNQSFSFFSSLLVLLKNFLILIIMIFYFFASSKAFYKSLNIDYKTDLKISTLEKPFLMAFDNPYKIFENFKIIHSYNILTEYQIKYSRHELEFKFTSSEGKQDKFDYAAKRFSVSDNNNLNVINLYFPRLDFILYKSAISDSEQINQNLYLAILCGKILERNPVTLDLLKYRTRPETNFISILINFY